MTSLLDQLRGTLEPTSGVLGGPNILVSWGEGNLLWRYGRDKGEEPLNDAISIHLSRSILAVESGGWLGRLLQRGRPEHLLGVELRLPARTLHLQARVDEDLLTALPERPARGAEVNATQLTALVLGLAAAGAQVQGRVHTPTPDAPPMPSADPSPSTPEVENTAVTQDGTGASIDDTNTPGSVTDTPSVDTDTHTSDTAAGADDIDTPADDTDEPPSTSEAPKAEPEPEPEPEPQPVAPLLPGVELPGGVGQQGSPDDEIGRNDWEDLEEVEVARALWMAQTPVTRGQWRSLMGFDPSTASPAEGGEAHPVDGVTWYEAVAFCNALSRAEGREEVYALSVVEGAPGEAGYRFQMAASAEADGYRLPSSAVWEYACRAGTTTATWAGDLSREEGADPTLEPIAVYAGGGATGTAPVGGRPANPWGLADLLGQVREWCEDGDPAREGCVARGGSWASATASCRAADWDSYQAHERSPEFGLRPMRWLSK